MEANSEFSELFLEGRVDSLLIWLGMTAGETIPITLDGQSGG